MEVRTKWVEFCLEFENEQQDLKLAVEQSVNAWLAHCQHVTKVQIDQAPNFDGYLSEIVSLEKKTYSGNWVDLNSLFCVTQKWQNGSLFKEAVLQRLGVNEKLFETMVREQCLLSLRNNAPS